MLKQLKRLYNSEDGATMVEYGIMVALIAAVCIVVVGVIGGKINNAFGTVNTNLK